MKTIQKTINYIRNFFTKKSFDREKQFMRTKNPPLKDIVKAYKNHIPRPNIKGKKNPNYKHGMGEDYKRIRVRGKKIKTSHIIWMLSNNKNHIPDGFVIHHINGNKRDDRIQNLKLENEMKHTRENLKQWKAQRIQATGKERKGMSTMGLNISKYATKK